MSSLFSLLTIVIVTGLTGFYYCGKRAYSLYLRISGDVLNKTNTPILPFVHVGKNLLITNRLQDFDRCYLVFSGTTMYFSVSECNYAVKGV